MDRLTIINILSLYNLLYPLYTQRLHLFSGARCNIVQVPEAGLIASWIYYQARFVMSRLSCRHLFLWNTWLWRRDKNHQLHRRASAGTFFFV